MEILENPVSEGQVYVDEEEELFVQIDKVWVDEDVETHVRISQYHEMYYDGDPVLRAHNVCRESDGYDATRTVHITDITGRIFGDELELLDY